MDFGFPASPLKDNNYTNLDMYIIYVYTDWKKYPNVTMLMFEPLRHTPLPLRLPKATKSVDTAVGSMRMLVTLKASVSKCKVFQDFLGWT